MGTWEVVLMWGTYSDAGERHLFFKGDNEIEVWSFLERYLKSLGKEIKNEIHAWAENYLFRYNKLVFNIDTSQRTNDVIINVIIQPLNVIYFSK